MSAEAADREAATSSRPCTPPQTSWFEFLLEEALLEQHLQKPSPDPPPVQLIVQFLEQASKPSVNEQNQVQPPPDNKRNRILKLLALKVAAHLKWDLDVLEKSLSVPVLNMLLNELLCISKVPPGTKHVDVDLSSLPPTTAMAILLYNRWAIRTIVQSSFPVKQVKPGPPQLNVMNQMQQEKELTENILKVLKEQAADSILVLEGALKLNKDLYVHTIRTLDLLAMEPGMVNGETESSTAGLKISAEEIQCQVCYDLGAIYFQQGSTNAAVHENAKEKFFKTKELIAKNGSSSLHFTIDEERLAGYCQACGVLTSSSDDASQQATPYSQIHSCMKSGNYQDVVKIFLEDNVTLSLPVQFRQSVLRELFQKAQQGNDALDEVCFKVCVCNTVCDVLQGRTIDIQFCQLFLKPSKEKIDFLLEVCSRSINLEDASEALKRKMAAFLKNLCLGLEDLQLVFMISSHELFIKLLKDDERKLLIDQMRKRSPRINLCTKPVTSFYDIPASASVNIGQLEHQLILSVDPWRIRQILIELHGMTSERQFWTVSNKWEVPNVYGNVILGIKDSLTRDLVYILMAKGLHCCTIKDFVHAKQLFAACLELVTEFSPKLRQVMLNEMLLLDIYTHEAGAGVSGERPPSDLISRVRGYLEMRVPDIPLRQVIAEECVAFLLNWCENEYLTMQVPLPLVQTNPYVKLGQLLAATCKELPGPKESRRTAKDLWEVVVQICSVSNQHKRGNDGRVSLIKHRESTLGIMYRSELLSFIKKLREPLVLTTILSLFVKLHNVREDIVNDIAAEHISIWPSSIPNLQSVDFEAVAVTVKELVSYALTINANNHFWLIIQADIYFATNQYSAALHYYLQAGAVCSDFFNKMVPPDVYTDQVIKRMIKCCSLLNCHTQVAILCQFLREVDYKTAFKALQEQNSHDAMDSYYEYIWDVTILEYLTYLHHKRGETDKRQIAIKAIGQTELNASNPEEVLQLAAQRRKKKFLQAMAKLYF
ncbi:integrator complex subunit 8 [Falco biarmicus]|uniref:integrator complex subunit 8 n=1 Tax=Falco cherrug TaxID=345164 RepID=UPI0018867A6A|nr:integrator complex subunit 8 isoform X1 [Falco rusticolus]XP_040441796.1 integrator complex subunit 8 isoform X1 [Falco naumanni]XP_055560455.1 integrator complex subunit 8 [Falco cherrug]XP_055655191.1 integrator complex subunit 8 [Falco peregrinus]XP_056187148.1 integrator complex subunit 8 [Falco biarmicus]